VEAIHEKLFGFDEPGSNSGRRVTECNVIHRDDLASEWEVAGSLGRSEPRAKILSGSFRHDAEILDGADITASTQIAIDSIISRAQRAKIWLNSPAADAVAVFVP